MQPINPIETKSKPRRELRQKSTARKAPTGGWLDGFIGLLAGVIGLAALGLCAYVFYGFVDTDKGVLTLLSSFVLCFGVGAAAYVPAFWFARIAKHSRRGTAQRRDYALAFALTLPWVLIAAFVITGRTGLAPRYGIAAVVPAGLLCLWALTRLRSPNTNDSAPH